MGRAVEPVVGLEPTTCSLRMSCSTTELNWHRMEYCQFRCRPSSLPATLHAIGGVEGSEAPAPESRKAPLLRSGHRWCAAQSGSEAHASKRWREIRCGPAQRAASGRRAIDRRFFRPRPQRPCRHNPARIFSRFGARVESEIESGSGFGSFSCEVTIATNRAACTTTDHPSNQRQKQTPVRSQPCSR